MPCDVCERDGQQRRNQLTARPPCICHDKRQPEQGEQQQARQEVPIDIIEIELSDQALLSCNCVAASSQRISSTILWRVVLASTVSGIRTDPTRLWPPPPNRSNIAPNSTDGKSRHGFRMAVIFVAPFDRTIPTEYRASGKKRYGA